MACKQHKRRHSGILLFISLSAKLVRLCILLLSELWFLVLTLLLPFLLC